MPVDPPAALVVAPLPHIRKLAFAGGALFMVVVIMTIRAVVGLT